MLYNVNIASKIYRLALEREEEKWKCQVNGDKEYLQLDARLIRPGVLSLLIQGRSYEISRDHRNNQTRLWIGKILYIVDLFDPRSRSRRLKTIGKNGTTRLVTSMPGKVLRVLVHKLEEVEKGQALVVIEAMKMQNEIRSPSKGVISQVVEEGIYVNPGDVLAIVEPII